MTFYHKPISISRHGINNDNIGPIAKASFEETPEMFLKAARHAELDTLQGISANVMCGQEGNYGTSCFQVLLDMEEMMKINEVTQIKHVNKMEEIEKLFYNKDKYDDKCSIEHISIQNNVIHIKPKYTGEDNDYNPF
jgi:DNA-directed RNA polymerase II subunit RPB1